MRVTKPRDESETPGRVLHHCSRRKKVSNKVEEQYVTMMTTTDYDHRVMASTVVVVFIRQRSVTSSCLCFGLPQSCLSRIFENLQKYWGCFCISFLIMSAAKAEAVASPKKREAVSRRIVVHERCANKACGAFSRSPRFFSFRVLSSLFVLLRSFLYLSRFRLGI